jgi:hypothetical protein
MTTSYLYRHVRSREASPLYLEDSDPVYSPRGALVRYNTKRQHNDVYSGTDDDTYDDYPRGATPKDHDDALITTTSRALTVRRPSQLERFNVYNHRDEDDDHHHSRSRHVHKYYVSDSHRERSRSKSRARAVRFPTPDSDSDSDRREREFRLKIKATLGSPRRPSSHTHSDRHHHHHVVEVPVVRERREKWVSDEYVDVWESESEHEREREMVRYRSVKRTRTDEWRPLSGFRRN